MDLGIYTFGDLVPAPQSGVAVSPRERVHEILTLARQADESGLDIVGVGEHHSAQFVGSATATLVAAMAATTTRVRLTSATTLLSTADPVRTFEEFATADLISNGRVEIIAGRGAFNDNFALFGYDLQDYDALFIEKLELLAALNTQRRVTWSGRFRAPLHDAEVSPRPVQTPLPVWIGAGSRASVARAAALGYPLALPMIGGTLSHYADLASLYRREWTGSGRPVETCRIGIYSHLYVAESARQVREVFFPYYAAYLGFFLKKPPALEQLEQMASRDGALVAGTPQEVVDKLIAIHDAVGCERYVGQMDVGGQPFASVVRSLELYATQAAPAVRQGTVSSQSSPLKNREESPRIESG